MLGFGIAPNQIFGEVAEAALRLIDRLGDIKNSWGEKGKGCDCFPQLLSGIVVTSPSFGPRRLTRSLWRMSA